MIKRYFQYPIERQGRYYIVMYFNSTNLKRRDDTKFIKLEVLPGSLDEVSGHDSTVMQVVF